MVPLHTVLIAVMAVHYELQRFMQQELSYFILLRWPYNAAQVELSLFLSNLWEYHNKSYRLIAHDEILWATFLSQTVWI